MMLSAEGSLFVGLLSVGFFKYAAMYRSCRQVCVGKVSAINIFPIKACKRLKLNNATVTYAGWKHSYANILDRYVKVKDYRKHI